MAGWLGLQEASRSTPTACSGGAAGLPFPALAGNSGLVALSLCGPTSAYVTSSYGTNFLALL